MECFNLNLLGTFGLESPDGAAITLPSKKSRALLVLLALSRDGVLSRDRLASYLWSNTELAFAKTNLRQCLSSLRKQLNNKTTGVLKSTGDRLQLDLEKVNVDALALTTIADGSPEDVVCRITAIDFGAQQLLPDFPCIDEAFDRWLDNQRTQLHDAYARSIERVLASCNELTLEIKPLTDELLRIEPANESAHLWQLKYYFRQGDRSAVIRQYRTAADALRQFMDAEPGTELTRLYQRAKQTSELPASTLIRVDENVPETAVDSGVGDSADRNSASTVTRREPLKSKHNPLWVVVSIVGVLTVILFYNAGIRQPEARLQTPVTTASISVPRYTALGINTSRVPQHTIAVLPFKNVSGDPGQTYLSDGLSEDLVTEISRISGLRVIASQSSFLYKGAEEDLDTLRNQLSVDYVLTGSVQRAKDNVRINAHLVRTSDGTYIWTDKFDRTLGDMLQVQDQITRHILASLSVSLTESEWKRLSSTREVSAEAYDLLLRGLHPLSQFTEDGVNIARDLFKEAIAADENYARPYANLALTFGREVVFGFADPDPKSIKLGLDYADKAERLDPSLPQTQFARAVLHLANREHVLAVTAARRSIALDANYADGYAVLSQTLAYKGELDIALEAIVQAKILNPVIPFMYHWVEGHILYQLARYEEARLALEAVYESNPSFYLGLVVLSATYAQLDQLEDSEWMNSEIMTHKPDFSVRRESNDSPYMMQKHRDHLLDGLQKAGLPK